MNQRLEKQKTKKKKKKKTLFILAYVTCSSCRPNPSR